MTDYKQEQYQKRYEIDGYVCQRCGKPATEIAHRINQNKTNIKKYGEVIIHHNFNLVSSCQKCNSYFSISNKPIKIELLIRLICGGGIFTTKEINDILSVKVK